MTEIEVVKINSIMYQSFQPYTIKEGICDEVYTVSYNIKNFKETHFLPQLHRIGYHLEGLKHNDNKVDLYIRRY